MPKVLLIEDDQALVKSLPTWLKASSLMVECVTTGGEGLELLALAKFDVIILDWGLPDMPGIEVLRTYRRTGGTAPVLMLTGRNQIESKELGLNEGADDYLTKPFDARELVARIRALLRRPQVVQETTLKIGQLELQRNTGEVRIGDQRIRVTKQELALLDLLMRHPEEIFSAEALLDRLWKSTSESSPQTVRMHFSRLRKKLEDAADSVRLVTVHGMGYKLSTDCSAKLDREDD